MKEILKLLLPEKIEALFYVMISLLCLILLSYSNLKTNIFNYPGAPINIRQQNWLSLKVNQWSSAIGPKAATFLVWLIIGCLIYLLISVIIASVRSVDEEVGMMHYFRSVSDKKHEWHVFITKAVIRLTSLIALFFWLFLFLGYINRKLVFLFNSSLLHISQPVSWLWLPFVVIIYALGLYSFAVLFRLLLLKERVFITPSEYES